MSRTGWTRSSRSPTGSLVLRDGRAVDARRTAEADPESLVRSIIGRPPEKVFVRPPAPTTAEPALVVDSLVTGAIGPVSFSLKRGEVLGLVGLRGAGHELISRTLIGAESTAPAPSPSTASPIDNSSIHKAVKGGLGFVAADRIAESIAPGLSIRENMFINPMASGARLFTWRHPSARSGERPAIRPAHRPGAQRARGVHRGPVRRQSAEGRDGALDAHRTRRADPRGPDRGRRCRRQGRDLSPARGRARARPGILLVSTDFEEVAAICHRALVFRDGAIVDEIATDDLSTESITLAASLAPSAGEARSQRSSVGSGSMQSIKSTALEPTAAELESHEPVAEDRPVAARSTACRLCTVLLIVIFSIALPNTFPTMLNLRSILGDKAIIAILSLAAMIPMMAGRIDLTVGYGIVLWHILAIALQTQLGLDWRIAVVIVLLAGAFLGLLNGLLVEIARIDSFIATLGTGTILLCPGALVHPGRQIVGALPPASRRSMPGCRSASRSPPSTC